VFEIRRRVLGEHHSDTTRSAWSLFEILRDHGDQTANIVLQSLSWLVAQESASLNTWTSDESANSFVFCFSRDRMISTLGSDLPALEHRKKRSESKNTKYRSVQEKSHHIVDLLFSFVQVTARSRSLISKSLRIALLGQSHHYYRPAEDEPRP
jgi:hypothetical protein